MKQFFNILLSIFAFSLATYAQVTKSPKIIKYKRFCQTQYLIIVWLLYSVPVLGQTNIALGKPATASASLVTDPVSYAFDGDANTHWGSGGHPVQWISVDLQNTYYLSSINFRVSQSPAGNTTHNIYFSSNGTTWVLATTMSGNTYDNQVITQLFQNSSTRYIKVETTQSPSWVSWFEIEVFGSLTLPVELLNFTTTPLSKTVELSWQTATERNASHFDLERSNNGKTFAKIGQVKANDNSVTLKSYSFIDETPFNGLNYYRLRQIDNDGKETLSKVVSISRSNSTKLKTYPNPVSNTLSVENTEGENFQILNLLGQQVLGGKAAQRIDVSALPKGSYVLKVGSEQVKFVKE